MKLLTAKGQRSVRTQMTSVILTAAVWTFAKLMDPPRRTQRQTGANTRLNVRHDESQQDLDEHSRNRLRGHHQHTG